MMDMPPPTPTVTIMACCCAFCHCHRCLPTCLPHRELQLVKLFGSVRDNWIAEDLQGWLAPNRIYPGVADAVKASLQSKDTEVYVVTTKQVCASNLQVLGRERGGGGVSNASG